MAEDEWYPADEPVRTPLDAIAHLDDGWDCGYNVGRECDCSLPTQLIDKLREHGYALVPLDPKKRPEGIYK